MALSDGLALGLLAAAVAGCTLWLHRAWRRGRARRRVRIGHRGEHRASTLLEDAGYRVEETQPRAPIRVRRGEDLLEVQLRADYMVSRGSHRYVVEVKTGDLVSNVRHGPTRRQLLEYSMAFNSDGVLLVDVAGQRIDHVSFPDFERPVASSDRWVPLLWAAGLLALAAAILLRR